MQTKHAEGIASNLFKVSLAYVYWILLVQLFMRMGIPKVVTSDQGTEFNNQLNEEFMRLLNNIIDHRLSTPYHPQVSVINITCTILHYVVITIGKWFGGEV